MKTLKNSYGRISVVNKKTNATYQVQFFNPLLKEINITESFKSHEDAFNFLCECNYDFFEKNSYLLPKGISIRRKDKNFVFMIRLKSKNIFVSSSKDLDEVCNDKFDFIRSFTS